MGVGIDIGSKSIKIVELSGEGTNLSLKGSGVIGYVGEPIEHIKDENGLVIISDTIRKLFKEAKISSKEVAIALPESQVFTRSMRFPYLTDQEIASAVKWEAEQYIPIPIEEAIVQHQILNRNETTTPPEVNVLLVASPRAAVEVYVKTIQMAGLKPVIVETELLSLVRSSTPDDGVYLLLDFGASSTDIAIAKESKLYFSRSIPTAGDAFTRAIAQSLNVDFQQAEQYKRTYGLVEGQLENKINAMLSPVVGIVSDEIKKAIHFYKTESRGDTPRSVILSGGTAGMPNITGHLAKQLNIEVTLANPFTKIKVDAETQKNISAYTPLYSIATGLAMREK